MIDGASMIIFDTDGTLVDGRQAIIDAVAEGLIATYAHFHLAAREPDRERIALAMGLPSTAFFRAAFDPAGVPATLHDAFASEFEVRSTRAEVAALRRGESRLYAGAVEALDALRADGHRLTLISNAGEPYFRTVVEVHGLARWFERTICLEQAVRRRLARTKAGMVRHLARGIAHVAVVGDRIHDIEAGMAVGARTVGCRFGFGEAAELAAADWVVDSLAELPHLPWRAARRAGAKGPVPGAEGPAPLSADAADRA
jgi:phosphoglycolate phosphatase